MWKVAPITKHCSQFGIKLNKCIVLHWCIAYIEVKLQCEQKLIQTTIIYVRIWNITCYTKVQNDRVFLPGFKALEDLACIIWHDTFSNIKYFGTWVPVFQCHRGYKSLVAGFQERSVAIVANENCLVKPILHMLMYKLCIYVHAYCTCVYAHYVFVCVYAFVCVCACMYVCMYICMCVNACCMWKREWTKGNLHYVVWLQSLST